MARELVGESEFIEIFVDTPIEICMQRDPKGLYLKAQAGEIANFTGISSPYEDPEHAEVTVKTEGRTAEDCAGEIVQYLRKQGFVP